jgi:hypothetical protein
VHAFPHRFPYLAAAALLTAVAGCSLTDGGGGRPVPTPSGETTALCRALHERLPGAVNGLERSSTGPASDFAANWGDPAVQLRCGVSRPDVLVPGSEHYNPTVDAVEVNGVTWLPEKQDDGYRFTTTGRRAYVEVTVPGRYAPELNTLTDLADAVRKSVPTEL